MGQQPGPIVVPPEPDLTCLVVEPSGNVPVTGHGGVAVIDGEAAIVESGLEHVGVDQNGEHAERFVVLDEAHATHVGGEVIDFVGAFGGDFTIWLFV